jgi:hypothetical protein
MGYDFLLKKSANERLCRVRKQLEKFGANPGLEAALTPSTAVLQFRCEALDDASVKKGDLVLIFTSGDEVKILKHNSMVGKMTSSAAVDFGLTAGGHACPEYQLGEVVSDASPLDKTFDVERRPPWDEPKPSKK